ncbi:MAG: SUMF1/EgtB/PvdO family nonheme iron enzyme [Pseudomonadota bacterium]
MKLHHPPAGVFTGVLRLLLLCCLYFFLSAAQSQNLKRLALLVGNDAYRKVPALSNAGNDARLLGGVLKQAGFDVTVLTDLDRDHFWTAIDTFKGRINKGDEVVFFFAGHGVQIGANQLLLPVDIIAKNDRQVERDGVSLVDVQDALRDARFAMLVIDACRDNPFPKQGTRAIGNTRGLSPPEPATGQVIVMSAGRNQTALDSVPGGTSNNGLFSWELAQVMLEPGLEVRNVLERVKERVDDKARRQSHEQRPSLVNDLRGNFYFFAAGAAPVVASAAEAPGKGKLPAVKPPVSEVPLPKAGTMFKDCPDCPGMVVLPAGATSVGSNDGEANEKPVHTVKIGAPFALGAQAVTRGQYAQFVQESGFKGDASCVVWEGNAWIKKEERSWRNPGFVQDDRHPAVCVSWDDAQAYLKWISAKTGKAYRLPSEAEAEYATRAGGTGTRYWGESVVLQCGFANGFDASAKAQVAGAALWEADNCNDRYAYTAPGGSFKPNAFGLYDTLGNVWQWTADCWSDNYAGAPADGSAAPGHNCAKRVVRGGSWYYYPRGLRAASRYWFTPDNRISISGLRVARSLP